MELKEPMVLYHQEHWLNIFYDFVHVHLFFQQLFFTQVELKEPMVLYHQEHWRSRASGDCPPLNWGKYACMYI